MREVRTEARRLVASVKLVVPETREQLVLDGRRDCRLIETPELAVCRHSCSDVEVGFLYVGVGRWWEEGRILSDILWQAILFKGTQKRVSGLNTRVSRSYQRDW